MGAVKKFLKPSIIIVILLLAAFFAWTFISPLFIDNEVHEELPFEVVVQDTPTSQQPPAVIEEPVEEVNISEQEVVVVEEVAQEEPEEESESVAVLTHQGTFEKIDYNVKGTFKIFEHEGKRVMRIENLDITNGPDVHLVFSNKWGKAVREYEIVSGEKINGEKFANKGSYNVDIPDDLDPDDFEYLLIHCVDYSHTFAGASIEKI